MAERSDSTSISKGDRVEALDCEKNWYLGTVVAIRRTKSSASAKVHFDGWSRKFDEWISFPSLNIRIRNPKSSIHVHPENSVPMQNDDSIVAGNQEVCIDASPKSTPQAKNIGRPSAEIGFGIPDAGIDHINSKALRRTATKTQEDVKEFGCCAAEKPAKGSSVEESGTSKRKYNPPTDEQQTSKRRK